MLVMMLTITQRFSLRLLMLFKRRNVPDSNIPLNNLNIRNIINGVYRICNKQEHVLIDGVSYTKIELHDATGLKIGLYETKSFHWVSSKPYALVNLRGYALDSNNQSLIQVLDISPQNKVGIDAMLSLPKALFNDPDDLEILISMRRSIESPALGQFLDALFTDTEIAIPFLQLPASSNHHHNTYGGLLKHSLEVAKIASDQCYDTPDERDIALVAALLHDIGKVRTLGTNLRATSLGKMLGHDALTLEVCAPALKLLDKEWPEAAYTLRHVWTCGTPGARYGFERNCKIANIIQFSDRLSVDLYDENKAFTANNKTDGLAWDGKKYYWRPTAEPKSNKRNNICQLTSTL